MATQLEDLAKNAKALRETIEEVERIVDEFARSVVPEVINATTVTVRRLHDEHDHGGFGKMPAQTIAPMSADVFGSRSSGIATGTEGSVTYALDDQGTTMRVHWDNPFAGENDSGMIVEGSNASWFDWTHSINNGNTSVHARYILGEKALMSPQEPDWRYCGQCTDLVYRFDEGLCPGKLDPTGLWSHVLTNVRGEPIENRPPLKFGPHEPSGWFFKLRYNAPGPNMEGGWRKCGRCKQLFFDGTEDKGACPVSSTERPGHVADGSGREYFLRYNYAQGPMQQNNWRCCLKCLCLFYEPHNDHSNCARDGDRHDTWPDYNYVIDVDRYQ